MIDPGAVTGAVLAGGDSTRFDGGDKALADLDGRPLVAHAVAAVDDATTADPVVGVRTPDQRDSLRTALPGRRKVRFASDVDGFSGPLAGIYAAAETASTPWLFVCACDMPLVTFDSVAGLWRIEGATGASAIVPRVDGRDQPLHALYRRSDLLAVRSSLRDGQGLYALVEALAAGSAAGENGVVRPMPADVDGLGDAVTNVNTRADLRAVRGTAVSRSTD